MEQHQSSFYVRVLTAAVIGLNVSGNYFLDVGMRAVGRIVSASPLDYVRAFANPWVILGVVLLCGWMICQLSLLSWADLTYVLPVTSSCYVLLALLGAFSLGEHVSASRWAGVCLIVVGVVIVGRTRPRTAPGDHEEQP
ncbi:MAG TPA: EamA family transporter [Bryobacteraceae bacterium]|nr:EamA family transporter [Bryobacteraceae bacterium]